MLDSAWITPIREKKSLDCNQIPYDDPLAPLLPPDVVNQSSDLSVEGIPRTTRFQNAEVARKEYKELSLCKLSKRRHRKFVYGALYKRIYPGYFEVDPSLGDFDLNIRLPFDKNSLLQIRLVAPDDSGSPDYLVRAAIDLGQELMRGPGNSRGTKVGDIGAMHAVGIKSAKTKETFVSTKTVEKKVKKVSTLMRHWMEDNMKEVLLDILTADKGMGVAKVLPYMPEGPSSRMVVSVNLGNAAHIDNGDTSTSVALWVEEKPGQAENWFFILPNLSYNGSHGVLVKLMHGTVISWDARTVYHCTSVTKVGEKNKVFGCMWGSCRK